MIEIWQMAEYSLIFFQHLGEEKHWYFVHGPLFLLSGPQPWNTTELPVEWKKKKKLMSGSSFPTPQHKDSDIIDLIIILGIRIFKSSLGDSSV